LSDRVTDLNQLRDPSSRPDPGAEAPRQSDPAARAPLRGRGPAGSEIRGCGLSCKPAVADEPRPTRARL